MAYGKICGICGAHLDSGEKCDCEGAAPINESDLCTLGRNVMARLNNIGMTKYDLARMMGYSSYLIDDILLGKKDYTASMLIKFAQVLRVSVSYLTK
jgi:hypothetical protein